MPSVIIEPSQLSFQCEEHESILAAATRQNILIPSACNAGSCQLCEMELIAGEVEQQGIHFNASQRTTLLACKAQALTDLRLRCESARHARTPPIKQCAAQIKEITALTKSLLQVNLLLPAGTPIESLPGQYLLVQLLDKSIPCYFYRQQDKTNAGHREIELILDAQYFDGFMNRESLKTTSPQPHVVTSLQGYLKQQFTLNITLPLGEALTLINPCPTSILLTSYQGLPLCRTLVGLLSSQDQVHSLNGHDNTMITIVVLDREEQCAGITRWFNTFNQDTTMLFFTHKPRNLAPLITHYLSNDMNGIPSSALYSCHIEENLLKRTLRELKNEIPECVDLSYELPG